MDRTSETPNGEIESEAPSRQAKSRESGTRESRQAGGRFGRRGSGQDSRSRSDPTEAARPKPIKLRCVFHTRVVVPQQRTATGRRYQFDAGQVQTVNPLDVSGLLALQREQPPGCCGSESNPRILKFFEKA